MFDGFRHGYETSMSQSGTAVFEPSSRTKRSPGGWISRGCFDLVILPLHLRLVSARSSTDPQRLDRVGDHSCLSLVARYGGNGADRLAVDVSSCFSCERPVAVPVRRSSPLANLATVNVENKPASSLTSAV
jgi:hypothetical protein